MKQQNMLLFFLMLIVSLTTNVVAQYSDSVTLLKKMNGLQFADHKPRKAKNGKDGDTRFGLDLFKLGKRGTSGRNAVNTANLKVHISSVFTFEQHCILVTVNVQNAATRDSFYINPAYGQLKIIADGGDGGDGGAGKSGERNAPGGEDGNGGNAGNITVYVDQPEKEPH